MSAFDYNQWLEQNDAYLAAALEWLRLRLARLAQGEQTLVIMPNSAAPPVEPHWWRFGNRDQPETPAALPPPSNFISTEHVAQAADAMTNAAQTEPPPALLALAELLSLAPFERDMLLLCVALELDTRIAGMCARAHDDSGAPYPTFALALALFDDPTWDAIAPERPLRYWRLLEIHQPAAQPLTSSALRADERIVNYIKGLNTLDDRVATVVVPLDRADEVELPASQQHVVAAINHHLEQSQRTQRLPVIQLLGSDTPSKQLIAWQIARTFGRHLYRLTADLLPTQTADVEMLARLWQRESILLPIALFLEVNSDQASLPAPFSRFLARSNGLVFLETREAHAEIGASNATFEIAKPTIAEQQAAWEESLGPAADDIPAALASQFNLNLPQIQLLAQTALATPTNDPDEPDELRQRLWNGCRLSLRPRLEALAQRIDALATWEQLVLPNDELALLHQIAAQVGQRNTVYEQWGFARRMNRGLGISALFAGESGTGKTMAAEVIANDLSLDLYRIDLSAVVSKYIGETEKNLRKLFDTIEDGGAILFFDEADALFGKRSEVKDSHDRYANIEINYLLQRMEAYRGLAILATNMKSALDPAFMRRLRFIVNFPFPGPAERIQMWQKAFPPAMPKDELDWARLARLNLTGGNIHTVALNAAFAAAHSEDKQVTMELVLAAARTEFRKLDRVVNEADFKWVTPKKPEAKAVEVAEVTA